MVTRKHTTDPYGVVDIHTESTDLLNATEAEYEAFMDEDDVGKVAGLLDHIERDVEEFWRKEGLPEPSAAHAARAERGSWVGMSWSLWRCLQGTRQAMESADLHRAVRFAFLLGQRQAETRLARRHGHDAQDGRGRKAARSAGGRAPKLDEDLWASILREDARLRRDRPDLTRNSRAACLAKRFRRGHRTIWGRIPG
jgi:hypothetical protein